MARRDYRKGAIPFAFVAIPKDVLRSDEFASAPPSSKALMLDLCAQYSGKNNGRLCPSFEVMRQCGWSSKNTLIRARDALLECSFAMRTRKGHPPRTAEWLGFTWWRLDWEESMDIGPRDWPYLNFAKTIPEVPKQDHKQRKQAPGGSVSGPMALRNDIASVQKLNHAIEVDAGIARGSETAPVIEVAISARQHDATS